MKSELKKEKDVSQKIKLDVPVRHQADESLECSVAALQMMMHYWDDIVSYHDLVRDLSLWVNKKERHLQGIGIYLAKRGYEVNFNYHDVNVIDKEIEGVTESDTSRLIDALRKVSDSDSTRFKKKKLSLDITYIEAGGKYGNEIPTLELIDSNLEKKIPVMICISQRIWQSNSSIRSNHYIVVVGRDGDKYIINDPSPKITSPYGVDKNKLLMAWYACGAYTLSASLKKTPLN